jgi:hypothetical protein
MENKITVELADPTTMETILCAACAAHTANAAFCRLLGDYSQPSWNEAPIWQRRSAIKGVLNVITNPDIGPGDSHRSWLTEKEETGWKYGPAKDEEAKLHPCMVPFDELPIEQQMKDFLFLRTVRNVLALRQVPIVEVELQEATETPEQAAATRERNRRLFDDAETTFRNGIFSN